MSLAVIYSIIFVVYNLLGAIICSIWCANCYAAGWELCNPYWSYQYYSVNWFGAVMISLLFSVLCPIGAVCYWFYKLCTIGRK